jgi:3'-phosphoadenosine 5'-phosphosulfate (PAPS) 3'-phosphatase
LLGRILSISLYLFVEEELAVAMEAAREAGALIKTAHEARGVRGPTVTVKSGIDLVTETDQACENLVLFKLKSRFPDYEFVGEESTFAAEGAHASHKVRCGICIFSARFPGVLLQNAVHSAVFCSFHRPNQRGLWIRWMEPPTLFMGTHSSLLASD